MVAPVLHYYVHGNGRGHATRTLPVCGRLREAGHEVRIFAGERAQEVFGEAGVEHVAIESVAPGPRLVHRFLRRIREDLGRGTPALVVTDGDGPSMHAARRRGVPVISVGHGLLFAHARLPIAMAKRDHVREALNAMSASWLATRRVVVHFGELLPRDARTVIARPDPRPELVREDGDELVAYGGRADVSPWVSALHARGHAVVVFGKAARVPPGVEVRPAGPDFAARMCRARGVVATAGSNLVSEVAALGLPLLALHPRGLVEQEVNARLAEREGFAVAAPAEAVGELELDRFEALLRDGPQAFRPPSTPTVSEAVAAAVDELLWS